MKSISYARKCTYLGIGAGVALFALFGFYPGSLLGGAIVVKMTGVLLGLPLEPGIISRTVVLASMLVGIAVSVVMMVTATSSLGWIIGKVVDAAMRGETVKA